MEQKKKKEIVVKTELSFDQILKLAITTPIKKKTAPKKRAVPKAK